MCNEFLAHFIFINYLSRKSAVLENPESRMDLSGLAEADAEAAGEASAAAVGLASLPSGSKSSATAAAQGPLSNNACSSHRK